MVDLNKQIRDMQKTIDFLETLKNMAKIIETQYDADFIVPIIGEMVDKFISEHLIYIFLRREHSTVLELVWPAACKDSNILEQVQNVTDFFYISPDRKTGFFPLLNNEGELLGVIVTKSTNFELSEKEIEYMFKLANQAATTLSKAKGFSETLEHATIDALTGFYNRRQLEERLKQATASARRQNTALCAVMIDVDFFKNVNDTYGHAAGDNVLKTVAGVIRSQLREYDIAGRYGGEEFALILPYTQLDEACMVAERLRNAVENCTIGLAKTELQNKSINITVSLGVYEFSVHDSDDDLLHLLTKHFMKQKRLAETKLLFTKR